MLECGPLQKVDVMIWDAVAATLLGVGAGWGLSELTDWRRRRNLRKAFAAALISEIEAVRDRYMEAIGSQIDQVPPDDYLKASAVIQENYFTVFESNADKIGHLEQNDATLVLSFYVCAKGQVDSLKTWHAFVGDLGTGPAAKKEYFEKIRNNQRKLLELVSQVTRCLRKYSDN